MIDKELLKHFRIEPGEKVRLKNHDSGWAQNKRLKELGKDVVKERAQQILTENLEELSTAQELLYADDRFSVLVVLQAMDAAGKDGTIKHVMSGVNPQGVEVTSFKHPSPEELDHTFLWRCMKALPERGRIGIFNRSYYEEVLVVKVHPHLIEAQRVPGADPANKTFWQNRYDDINHFEQHLARNGTAIVKFFLNVSRDQQRQRFLERIDNSEKHWKFSAGDVAEAEHWDEYQRAYEQCLEATSTAWAPWYVIPADKKWVTRAAVAAILTQTIRELDLKWPKVTDKQKRELAAAKRQLERDA